MSKKRGATKALVDDSDDDDSRSDAPIPTTKPSAAAKCSKGGSVFEDSVDEPAAGPSADGGKTLRPPPPPLGGNKKLRPLRLEDDDDDDDDDDDSSSDNEEVVRGSSSTSRKAANKVSRRLEDDDFDEDDDLALLQQESKIPISQVKAAYTRRMLDNLFGDDSDDDDDSDYCEPTTTTANKPPPSALRFTLDKKTPIQNLSFLEHLLPGLFADIADYCWIQDLHSLAATSKRMHLAVKNLKSKCQKCSTGLLFTTTARLKTTTTVAGNCSKCHKRMCAHCVYPEERRVQMMAASIVERDTDIVRDIARIVTNHRRPRTMACFSIVTGAIQCTAEKENVGTRVTANPSAMHKAATKRCVEIVRILAMNLGLLPIVVASRGASIRQAGMDIALVVPTHTSLITRAMQIFVMDLRTVVGMDLSARNFIDPG